MVEMQLQTLKTTSDAPLQFVDAVEGSDSPFRRFTHRVASGGMQISIAMQLHCIRGSFSTVVSVSGDGRCTDGEREIRDRFSLTIRAKKFSELPLSVANFFAKQADFCLLHS